MSIELTIIWGIICSLLAAILYDIMKAVIKRSKSESRLYRFLFQRQKERTDNQIELAKSQNAKTSVYDFLDEIEKRFNEITLFHLPESVSLTRLGRLIPLLPKGIMLALTYP